MLGNQSFFFSNSRFFFFYPAPGFLFVCVCFSVLIIVDLQY